MLIYFVTEYVRETVYNKTRERFARETYYTSVGIFFLIGWDKARWNWIFEE